MVVVASFALVAPAAADSPAMNERAKFVSYDLRTGRPGKTFDLGTGRSMAQAAVAGDVLVVDRPKCGSQDRTARVGDQLLAGVDLRSGATKWTRENARLVPVGGAAPVLAQDTNGPTGERKLRALAASNGSERWTQPLLKSYVVTADDSTVIVTDRDPAKFDVAGGPAVVRALDRRTGKVRWQQELGDTVGVGASIDGDTVALFSMVPAGSGALVNSETTVTIVRRRGAAGTSYTIPFPPSGMPALVGPVVVSLGGPVVAYDAPSGASRWTAEAAGVVVSGHLLARADSITGFSYASLDPATGRQLWASPSAAGGRSISATPSTIVLQGADEILTFDAATGTERWRSPMPKLYGDRYAEETAPLPEGTTAIGDRAFVVAGGCALSSAR
jgi:outer membrane protein assembly factor BamB